jgi:chromosome segregation ATPase
MTARRRPPKERRPTEPKSGDDATAVVLEHLRDQRVFLEQMGGQMRVVSERALDTLTKRESLELAERIEGQMGMLMDAFRVTRGELGETRKELGETRGELGETRKELGEMRKELGETRTDLGARIDGLEHEVRGVRLDVARQAQGAELRALDQRMTVVERHLGI